MENKNNLLNQDSTLTWCSVEKDHLRSNRVVREETSGINRLQTNHYYPFATPSVSTTIAMRTLVFSATSSMARSWISCMVCASTTMAQECMTKYLAVGQVWTQWRRNIIISARMCSVWTILYEWWIEMERIHGIFSQQQMQQPLTSDTSIMIILYEKSV